MRDAPVASITSRSKPSAMPLAGGIAARRREEVLVERVALAIDPHLLVHLGLEAAALLGRVGQLAEGVGELDPAGIELEPLGDARVAGGRPRERRLATGYSSRIVARPRPSLGSTRSTRTRLKRSDQVSSAATRTPAAARPRGERVPVGAACARQGREEVDAGEALEGLGHGQALGLANGSAVRPRKARPSRRPPRPRAQARRSPPSAPRRARRPVPFEHGELRMVQGPALAVAEHPGEGEAIRVSPAASSFLQANSGEVWR